MINHPSVRPFIGLPDAGELDMTPLLERPENMFPFGEHGGFALVWTAPHSREVHTFILPGGRGRWARDAAREGIALARDRGTAVLWTKIPPDAPHVRSYAVGMGMSATGETIVDAGVSYEIYSMAVTCQ